MEELRQRRRTEFASEQERAEYDAVGLVRIFDQMVRDNIITGDRSVGNIVEIAARMEVGKMNGHIDTPGYKELLKLAVAQLLRKGVEVKPVEDVTRKVADKATKTAIEQNDHGVLMKDIADFVSELELDFGVDEARVLARLKTMLTPDLLKNLIYWQRNNHKLDVTEAERNGRLFFDTCSIETPNGAHMNLTIDEMKSLAKDNGAVLMNPGRYERLARKQKSKGIVWDENTLSWLGKIYEGDDNYYYGAHGEMRMQPSYDIAAGTASRHKGARVTIEV